MNASSGVLRYMYYMTGFKLKMHHHVNHKTKYKTRLFKKKQHNLISC